MGARSGKKTAQGHKVHGIFQISLQILSALIMVFSLAFTAYNTYLLIQDKRPFLVSSDIICPQTIITGAPIEVTLSNVGGRYTEYDLSFTGNGFKCFNNNILKVKSLYESEVTNWNAKCDLPRCDIKGFLAKDTSASNTIFAFPNNRWESDTADFRIGYTYMQDNKEKSLPAKTCSYKKTTDNQVEVWVIIV